MIAPSLHVRPAYLLALAFFMQGFAFGQALDYRNWAMATGKQSDVTLAVVGKDAETVRLKRKDDGRVIRVRISKLSGADQAYLRGLLAPTRAAKAATAGWSQFRGPNAQGRIPAGDYPTEWTESKNVKWKMVPGPGASSPVLAGGRLFYTTYSGYGLSKDNPGNPDDLRLHLVCLDADRGETVWRKEMRHRGEPRPFKGAMAHMGYAAHTPAVDGSRIYCHFGNHGVDVFDMDGKPLWNDGPYSFVESNYGSGASPTLYDNLLLVNTSMEDNTLRAFDRATGRKVWTMEQNEQSYTTPTLIRSGADPLMLISGRQYAKAFDPRSGEQRWRFKHGRGGYVIPIPAYDGGEHVYTLSPNGNRPPLAAVPVASQGDVGAPAWASKARGTVGSALLVNGYLYSFDWLMTCHRASDGEQMYEARVQDDQGATVGGAGYASSIAIGDLIYLTGQDGHTAVLKAGPECECISVNLLREPKKSTVHATLAASDGRLYLRSDQYLYCIANP